MDPDIKKAKQGLELLPPLAEKSEALRLLAKMEEDDAKQKALFENLERAIEKCQPNAKEDRIHIWLSWFSILLGCIATYDGLTAILTKEFCYLSRGSQICTSNRSAQIHGVLILLAGIFLFSLALQERRWRTVSLWTIGLSLFFLLLWALLGG